MLTYDLEKRGSLARYDYLYRCIKEDILSGRLKAGEKLPSKRTLATHLNTAVVTVENAYAQLEAEGYLNAREKRGYFVNPVETGPVRENPAEAREKNREQREWRLDLRGTGSGTEGFPFSVWARLMRRILTERGAELLQATPHNGVYPLRQAIARHLYQFRGISAAPEQIVVGAGTEYLYNLIVQLLGRDLLYGVEDPGYSKAARIYGLNGAGCIPLPMDSRGVRPQEVEERGVQILHISPNHQFPTGTVTPILRRQALLRWAEEQRGYIIEDDYDSELRHTGLPVPPLFSLDGQGRVLYLSTFSQTIAPSLRIAYLCLPPQLMERLRTQLGFYACAVPSFEQFTLARFIASGDYERHLNRLRKRFREKRAAILAAIAASALAQRCEIIEENAGTHFLLRLATSRSDAELKRSAAECGLSLRFLSDYRSDGKNSGCAIVNYACMPTERLPAALETLAELL